MRPLLFLGLVLVAGCRIGCQMDDYDRGYQDGACLAGTRWCAMITEEHDHVPTAPCVALQDYCTGRLRP